ncbi:MAG TPA: adenylate/guanylate cyclase domain-containing protein [Candidatus Limnocylindrales bacterium]|nr:adenylate/guanylate cyclase domain-containing protein [Candidatus Limnocylindrales bacterium]
MTSLFCDLVGFTAQSEATDPEDVDRTLGAYFRLARAAIERHGGVVEKFIGDAVVGVFGAPVAHEDDPARAVRAGLEICREARRLTSATGAPLRLRVGVNTGDALVHLDARPQNGEPMQVGDAVNTAARIQAAAPELGVAVGVRTWEATRLGFDYEALPPASLKGKSDPVLLFHARSERQVRGVDAARTHAGRYVGREAELDTLRDAYLDVRATRRTRLALIVGEPGIGKSRLLAELGAVVRASDAGARWHQGRCLPYGDGTGFWALGEVVKSYAGILEGDDAATARAQLTATLRGLPDPAWLEERIGPLLGLGGDVSVARDEQFAAWARYLRSMPGPATAVIALEDVHWADPALLAFLGVLSEPADAAVLVVLTTRPSIAEVAPTLGARAERPVRLELGPLTDAETEALVVGLLGSIVPNELHARIIERSRGNPLYAEELVRLLGDRDLLERRDGVIRLRPGVAIPLPETIHGLLASRLDAVSETERAILARAAVVGATFWPAAVEALGEGDATPVRDALDSLERRQLVRRQAPSSLAGEPEYAFWHVLLRDVAYEALPRRARIDGHLATVTWIEAAGGHRADVAGILAHHLTAAYDLAVATADLALAEGLGARARTALAEAAEAASAMDASAALPLYRRALDLATDETTRATLLLGYGRAAERAGQTSQAIASLNAALAAYEATGRGDTPEAAMVLLALRPPLMDALDLRWQDCSLRALEILEPLGPSPLLVEALIARAWAGLWEDPQVPAREYAGRALDAAAAAGLPMPHEALALRGQARMTLETPAAGLADFERAFETAVADGAWEAAGTIALNYVGYVEFHHGPARADALDLRALEICETHGLRALARWFRIGHAESLVELGRLDDARATLAEIADDVSSSGNRAASLAMHRIQASIAMTRGDDDRLRELLPVLDGAADGDNADGSITDAVIHAGLAHHRLGDRDRARHLLRRAMGGVRAIDRYWLYLAPMTRLALALGDVDLAADVTVGVPSRTTVQRLGQRTSDALVAEARGAYEEAVVAFQEVATSWAEFGAVLETGLANLGAARCLIALGQVALARAPLDAAGETFARVASPPLLAAIEEVRTALDASPDGHAEHVPIS